MAELSHQPGSWQDAEVDRLFGPDPNDPSLCRYRMELDLRNRVMPGGASLPPGYQCSHWRSADIEDFALVLYRAFVDTPDALIIPSFRSWSGCRELARAVAQNGYFWPSATLLVRKESVPVACVQVMGTPEARVNIQNIGVVPESRGQGLGAYLLSSALDRVQRWGANRVGLEVTADNQPALALYRRFGFQPVCQIWKKVMPQDPRDNPLAFLPEFPNLGSQGSSFPK